MKLARTIQIDGIDAALPSAVPPIEALPRPSRVPVSLPQQRLWFLSRLAGGSEAVHIQMGLRLCGDLNEAALQPALDGLVARHKVLRTTFGAEDGEPFQRLGPANVGVPLKRDDPTAAADVEATLAELMRHEAQVTFDVEAGPLIRGRLVRMAMDDHVLLITMHYMVSDDWSRKILTRELSELFAAAPAGPGDRGAAVAVGFGGYARLERRLGGGGGG
ncbi:condensation domain-containing protein, partial [Mesorhizobium sp. M0119]|uniref:condensation domain-containing protein n=1 Tax=Mesorhizobium sp. M0119 TaxID=2956885 RepID=UPI0033390F10